MTRALEVGEQPALKTREAEWERDRKAWNLPRRPVGTDSGASGSPEAVGRNGSAASPVGTKQKSRSDEPIESGLLEAWENEGGAEARLSA
jgi:hypothetical protein